MPGISASADRSGTVAATGRERKLRSFDRLALLFVACATLPLVLPPLVPLEPVWEASAGFGYVACAAAILGCSLGWRRRAQLRPLGVPEELTLHRWIGHAIWLGTLLHVATILVLDPESLRYMTWTMPVDVLFGFLAAAALLAAVLTKEPLRRPLLRRLGPASTHALLALLFVAFSTLHVALGQAKLLASWQVLLLLGMIVLAALPSLGQQIGLGLAPVLGERLATRLRRPARTAYRLATGRHMVWLVAMLAAVFLCAVAAARLGLRL
ncbi:hypothetical protein SH611_03300 [Geminicoccaceae bacterium 1502E]|nr:hypothetical protein [Geminicoccaceae bacterium 1502E]